MKIYVYKSCGTCQKALKFLNANGVSYEALPIRETPPTETELKIMLQAMGDLKKLFNTSGVDYRELNIKDQLKSLSESEAIALLASNGNLIKRPFLLSEKLTTVGFDEAFWQKSLLG